MPDPDPENVRFYASGAETPEQHPDGPVVRIYRAEPNPMQSGKAHTGEWIAEFEPQLKPGLDPLMGWISSADARQQVRLAFHSVDEAVAWCRRQKMAYDVIKPGRRRKGPKSYTDNFVPFEDGTPKPIYQH